MLLPGSAVSRRTIGFECLLFNLGNAGVMAGTLTDLFIPVAVGTILIAIALAIFLYSTRGAPHSFWL